MNLSELTIAYSPRSDILEDVIRDAMSKLFDANEDTLKKAMTNQINLPDLEVENNTVTLPNNISGVDLKWNITLPHNITLPENLTVVDFLSTMIKDEILKSLLNFKAYNRSRDMKNIYSKEKTTRSVLCAIQFNDSLLG